MDFFFGTDPPRRTLSLGFRVWDFRLEETVSDGEVKSLYRVSEEQIFIDIKLFVMVILDLIFRLTNVNCLGRSTYF